MRPRSDALVGRVGDDGDAVTPRDAATVVLLREQGGHVECFFMRRTATMAFAAGMYVFPGGGVQPSDLQPAPWSGPAPAYWGERLGCAPELAAALVTAAVRETFEETGVLLAGPDERSTVTDTATPELVAARAAVERGELEFSGFLRRHGLVLRADLLQPWSRWITPAAYPRRFDARFFVARLPEGQTVGTLAREADQGGWAPIETGLSAVETGQVQMMHPTIHTCRQILSRGATDVLELAHQPQAEVVLPERVTSDGESFWRFYDPGDRFTDRPG